MYVIWLIFGHIFFRQNALVSWDIYEEDRIGNSCAFA
jgi:hypothetical protein